MTTTASFRTAEQAHPVYLVRGVANVLTQPWTIGDDVDIVAPTSATLTLRNASGTAAGSPAISGAAVAITGSIMTYTITAAILDAETFGAFWQAEWTPLHSSVTYAPIKQRVSLCKSDLLCPVSNRSILTLHPEFNTYPSGAASWMPQIEAAWTWVLCQIEQTGRRPELVIGADTLYMVALYKSLGLIARHLFTYMGDPERWASLAAHYDREPFGDERPGLAQQAWAKWRADYDLDGDGQVQSDEAGAQLHAPGWAF